MSCIKSLLSKKVYDQKRLEKAIRNSSATAGANGAEDGKGGGGSGGGGGGSVDQGARGGSSSNSDLMVEGEDSDGVEVVEVERTELEIATEAAVVRGKGVSRQARKELRQSMTRCVGTGRGWAGNQVDPEFHSGGWEGGGRGALGTDGCFFCGFVRRSHTLRGCTTERI